MVKTGADPQACSHAITSGSQAQGQSSARSWHGPTRPARALRHGMRVCTARHRAPSGLKLQHRGSGHIPDRKQRRQTGILIRGGNRAGTLRSRFLLTGVIAAAARLRLLRGRTAALHDLRTDEARAQRHRYAGRQQPSQQHPEQQRVTGHVPILTPFPENRQPRAGPNDSQRGGQSSSRWVSMAFSTSRSTSPSSRA